MVFSMIGIHAQTRAKNTPKTNYVPNQQTAIKIAEAVWLPIYGESVLKEKPFNAKLIADSVWVVTGTLPDGFFGGTAYIEIQKADCKILKVTHGQ